MPLTGEQRAILWDEETRTPLRGHRVIAARPGTGKTHCLVKYCSDLLHDWTTSYQSWQGLAVLSYTNVAKDELAHRSRSRPEMRPLLAHPHFCNTIDSFVNQYIFLPHAASYMSCTTRPRLVGEPFGQYMRSDFLWNNDPSNASSSAFFDCYTIGAEGPLRLTDEPRRTSSTRVQVPAVVTSGNQRKIVNMKKFVWTTGIALQSDANYIAYELLRGTPGLARSLALRFPVLVIDEAQDMTEVQHGIVDLLCASGLAHVVLIGDDYQAIYEWNTAKPELFDAKRHKEGWKAGTLAATFRCSPAVSHLLTAMAADDVPLQPVATNKNFHYNNPVKINGYRSGEEERVVASCVNEMAELLDKAMPHSLDKNSKSLVILARSQTHVAYLQTLLGGGESKPTLPPAVWKHRTTRDYLKVLHHLTQGDYFSAFRAYEAVVYDSHPYRSLTEMRDSLDREWSDGSRSPGLTYRDTVARDLAVIQELLPGPEITVTQSAALCNIDLTAVPRRRALRFKSDCATFGSADYGKTDRLLSSLFPSPRSQRPLRTHDSFKSVTVSFSTVHGVKGETHDGVVFFTGGKTSRCNCKPSATKWVDILQHPLRRCELKRIAYVACSRAAQLLSIITPSDVAPIWHQLTDSAPDPLELIYL